jgi:uncharacterized protein YggU (UPF0235/DUF167 family)
MSAGRPVAARLTVAVTPRAGSDAAWADETGLIRVRVRAAPADGAANSAVAHVLADALGLPPSRLRIVAGTSSRRKIVAIEGLHAMALERRVAQLPAQPPTTRGR